MNVKTAKTVDLSQFRRTDDGAQLQPRLFAFRFEIHDRVRAA
ncbi:hypothetical protein QT970_26005 [Microcoleus sp. herbarium8]